MDLTDRVQETREKLTTRGTEIFENLQTRGQSLREQAHDLRTRSEELLENRVQTPVQHARESVQTRAEELKQHANDALDSGFGRLVLIEARVLGQAREVLGRAHTILGDRATFLNRGEEALTEALIALRATHEVALPIDNFDDLSIKRAQPFLAELDIEDLQVVRAFEVANKNRVTLIRAIDKRLEALTTES